MEIATFCSKIEIERFSHILKKYDFMERNNVSIHNTLLVIRIMYVLHINGKKTF